MATAAPTQKAYDAVSVRRHILKLGANAVAVALHSSLPLRPRRVSGGEGGPGLPSGCSSPLSRQSIRRCPDGAPVILRSHGAGSRGQQSSTRPPDRVPPPGSTSACSNTLLHSQQSYHATVAGRESPLWYKSYHAEPQHTRSSRRSNPRAGESPPPRPSPAGAHSFLWR